MASVFTVIAFLIYGGRRGRSPFPPRLGSFFLFLGLKKKNRDHLMCSFLLFLAAALARPGGGGAGLGCPDAALRRNRVLARALYRETTQTGLRSAGGARGLGMAERLLVARAGICGDVPAVPANRPPGSPERSSFGSIPAAAVTGGIASRRAATGIEPACRLLADNPRSASRDVEPVYRWGDPPRGRGGGRLLEEADPTAPDQPPRFCRPGAVGRPSGRSIWHGRGGLVGGDRVSPQYRFRPGAAVFQARGVALLLVVLALAIWAVLKA